MINVNVPVADFHSEENKLSNWFDTVKQLDVPTPETVSIDIERGENGKPRWDTDQVVDIVHDLGGEAFVRSDFKSARNIEHGSHINWAEPESVDKTLEELVVQHIMMNMPLGDQIHLREWIDLNWNVYAQETCHPEVRFFVRDGDVTCYHLRVDFDDRDLRQEAKRYLNPNNSDFKEITERVHGYARDVAEAFEDENWYAVDFVLDTNCNWYLTDIALDALYKRDGELSNIAYHPDNCEHNLEKRIEN